MATVTAGREHVAVIGAGASGVLTAVQLLRRGTRVTLIEREGFGGAAYSTRSPQHLLNVRAANMSGLDGEPDSFLDWLAAHGHEADPQGFVPRHLFRSYLAALLRNAAGAADGAFERLTTSVTDLGVRDSGVTLVAGHETLRADRVVLALGNPPPASLGAFADVSFHPGLQRDPWRPGAVASIASDAPVLIVGTGLTAIDVLLDLRASGHHAPVTMVSRNGALPRPHCEAPCPVVELALPPRPRLAEVVSAVSVALQAARAQGRCDHGVIDGLRPVTAELWQGFSTADKDTFLREYRPWWETRRHRIPPQVHEVVTAMRADGSVAVRHGTLGRLREHGSGLRATLVSGGRPEVVDVGAVVNCTGPASVLDRRDGTLIQGLLRRGLVRIDPWGLGIETTGDGAVIDRRGRASGCVYTIGPLRRGSLYESTAIPEIRGQAASLANHLTATAAMAVGA